MLSQAKVLFTFHFHEAQIFDYFKLRMKARTIILQIQACIIFPTAIVKMYSISCVILKSEATSENIRGLEYNQNSLILKKNMEKINDKFMITTTRTYKNFMTIGLFF